jgi:hypothetical protein
MAKNKEQQTEALVKIEAQYPIFGDSSGRQAEIMKRNVGEEFSPLDLDRIKIPSGGGLSFSVPSIDGDTSMNKIECILLYKKDRRNNAFWNEPYSGENVPPDCSSVDGISGVGIPGGKCKDCPKNQFGSDPRGGKGKACQNRQFIFILLPGDSIPYAMSLPPTSLKAISKYTLGLARKNLMYHDVITEIGLEAIKGGGVPEYSRALFKVAKDENGNVKLLNEQERNHIEKMVFGKSGMREAFEAVSLEQKDLGGDIDTDGIE